MKIIGVIGHARSGKDTIADLLQEIFEEADTPSCRKSLADPIKDLAFAQFGWDGLKDDRGRNLLITLGMIGREYNERLWLDKTLSYFRFWNQPINIIPDVRFQNEADHIFANGGLLIRVIRDSVEPMDHISERGLDDYLTAITLRNNGTIEELKAELYSELQRINMI
tara:strand:- start:1864 stop:2364 length:501 start_codon:yes stop_codon:yes gene_type:complete